MRVFTALLGQTDFFEESPSVIALRSSLSGQGIDCEVVPRWKLNSLHELSPLRNHIPLILSLREDARSADDSRSLDAFRSRHSSSEFLEGTSEELMTGLHLADLKHWTTAPLNQWLTSRAMKLIYTHIAEPQLSVAFIARMLSVSVRTLERAFHDVKAGGTWSTVQEIRMQQAIRLLSETDLAIGKVALAVGFRLLSSFTRAFQTRFHCPPTAYRKKDFAYQEYMRGQADRPLSDPHIEPEFSRSSADSRSALHDRSAPAAESLISQCLQLGPK